MFSIFHSIVREIIVRLSLESRSTTIVDGAYQLVLPHEEHEHRARRIHDGGNRKTKQTASIHRRPRNVASIIGEKGRIQRNARSRATTAAADDANVVAAAAAAATYRHV